MEGNGFWFAFFGYGMDATLDLTAAQLPVAPAGNTRAVGGRSISSNQGGHGLFGALLHQQLQGSQTMGVADPQVVLRGAMRNSVDSAETPDPKDRLPLRGAEPVSGDSGVFRAKPKNAVSDPASAVALNGANATRCSAGDGEEFVLPQTAENAGPSDNLAELVAAMSTLGGARDVMRQSAPARNAAGTDLHRGSSVKTPAEFVNATTGASIETREQAPAGDTTTAGGKTVAEAGAAGPIPPGREMVQSEPEATAGTSRLPDNGAVANADPAPGLPGKTGDTSGPSACPVPGSQVCELSAVPAGPALAVSPASSGKTAPSRVDAARSPESPRSAIAAHHERKAPLSHSTDGPLRADTAPATLQAAAGSPVVAAEKSGTTAGSPLAGSLRSAPSHAPTQAAKANLPGAPTAQVRVRGDKADGASSEGPALGEPGDGKNTRDAESGRTLAEHRVHAERTEPRAATERAGTFRTTEAQNQGRVSALGTPQNSGGEVATVATFSGPQSIHTVAGTAHSPGVVSEPHSTSSHVAAGAAFERMDTAPAPRVMESTPHRLAVGVENGGLGWVEIHTSSAAGHVSATLASGSAESQHAITAQLPAVREWLAGEHVRVDTLTSERFSASSGGREGSSGDQAGRGSAQTARRVETDGPARSADAETEWEGMSYISVRV